MKNGEICFYPELDKWVITDSKHYIEVPMWARNIIANHFDECTKDLREKNELLRNLLSREGIEVR